MLYLGDIDLSSFGPYYGDAWSSLEDFERTLTMARGIAARCYATFHHVGVLDGRDAFVERIDRFAAVIERREAALLGFLAEPHTMAEIVAHRFVYRPQDAVPYADAVERRSMSQHLVAPGPCRSRRGDRAGAISRARGGLRGPGGERHARGLARHAHRCRRGRLRRHAEAGVLQSQRAVATATARVRAIHADVAGRCRNREIFEIDSLRTPSTR